MSDFQRWCKVLCLLVIFVCALPLLAQAADIAPQSELAPAPTFEPQRLPNPTDVPGKEYSNELDKDAAGNLNPGQVVHWKGNGTNVWDSINYYLPSGGGGGGAIPFETDALANIRDKYFMDLDGNRAPVQNPEDQQWYHDTVSLAVSLQKKQGYEDNGYQKNIYASRSAFRGGGAQKWADWQTNINAKSGALDDLDGLEMYGPDDSDDANMYSRQGDPNTDGLGRVSVFRYHPQSGLSVPYLRTSVLQSAMIVDGGGKPDWQTHNPDSFDVDAMMIWDVADDDVFGPGDQILFSVRPIEGLFDGGEIWLYKYNEQNLNATFLVHGLDGTAPRTWNTANQVSMHFFGDNLHGENIDALEAIVPEPSTFILLLAAAVPFAWRCFRRQDPARV